MTETEMIKLPMICTCGTPGSEQKAEREAKAREIRERAYSHLSSDRWECTAENFLSSAVGTLYWSFNAEFECAVDQWYGAYATVKKYVECEHGKVFDEALKNGATTEEIEAIEDPCPDEPECFVYRWDPVLKVRAECDRLEDGLAAIVNWFFENRKPDDD